MTPSSSGHFTTVMVLSMGPGSGSSTSSRTLCFRISTYRRASPADDGSSATPSHLQHCIYEFAPDLVHCVWWQTTYSRNVVSRGMTYKNTFPVTSIQRVQTGSCVPE
jgi:hypothetical protein